MNEDKSKIAAMEHALKDMAEAHRVAMEAEHKRVVELEQQLAQYHEAMQRERKADWENQLKDLADYLELPHTGEYATLDPNKLSEAARQLRYMANCFTLKANFVPSDLRIKELEQQLAQAQAELKRELRFSHHPSGWLSPDEAKALTAKKDYFLQDNQRLKAELERVCDDPRRTTSS